MVPSRIGKSFVTPLEPLPTLSKELGVSLWIKRDDAYPEYGGGNKARKIGYILEAAEQAGANALVTAGGAQSNHARVVALAAARRGWQATLVIHEEEPERMRSCGNLMVSQLAGAKIRYCSLQDAAKVMDEEMEVFRNNGAVPYYIYGGGHNVQGTYAYYEAVQELKNQIQGGWNPDYIVVSSGLGSTQAGIHAGAEVHFPEAKVIGVSVARGKERGSQAVAESLKELGEAIVREFTHPVEFRDEWIFGGYEGFDPRLREIVSRFASKEGVIVDPTYSGKAALALFELVKRKEIPQGSNVLFWHTGGIMNLLTSAHFLENPIV